MIDFLNQTDLYYYNGDDVSQRYEETVRLGNTRAHERLRGPELSW